jgi:CSLREA domain-containing protein
MMTRTAIYPLKILTAVGAALLLWGVLLAYTASPAKADTITVNSDLDGAPANNGACTLREAIINANADNQSGSTDCAAGSRGPDVIDIVVTGTVNLTGALPPLESNIEF